MNRMLIDERPKIVDEKSRIGDWEIDTVVGCHHKGFLVTLVERVTKFTLIRWVKHKYALQARKDAPKLDAVLRY